MDYKNAKITLKKNNKFNSPFHYNKSGIVLEQNGIRVVKEKFMEKVIDQFGRSNDGNTVINFTESFRLNLKPAFTIAELRKDSPAERAGLLVGDIIVLVNGKSTHTMKLQDIVQIFSDEDDKLIRLVVERNFNPMRVNFRLENPLK
jgi:C-terminal processing protease CtpA/Prc